MRSNARKKSKYGIGFGFPVVVNTYDTPGIEINWVVLFKVPQGIYTDNPGFILCMIDAAKNAPILLSRRKSKNLIDSIRLATGKKNFNKKTENALLSSILKDGSTPFFCDSTFERHLVNGITHRILCVD